MASEDNKALVRRFFEAIDTGEVSRAEPFIAPGFTDHNPPPFPNLAPGLEGFRQGFDYGLSAFSDFQHTIEDQIVEGDKVVTRLTASGVHTGDFLGIPPTGK